MLSGAAICAGIGLVERLGRRVRASSSNAGASFELSLLPPPIARPPASLLHAHRADELLIGNDMGEHIGLYCELHCTALDSRGDAMRTQNGRADVLMSVVAVLVLVESSRVESSRVDYILRLLCSRTVQYSCSRVVELRVA